MLGASVWYNPSVRLLGEYNDVAGQFSSRNVDRDQVGADAASLPLRSNESQVLENEFVALRFTMQQIDQQEIVTRLHLEARHPKVAGDVRVFDLTSILAEGYRKHPGTVAQIVHPGLSMDARLDALHTVAIHCAGMRDSIPPVNEPSFTTSAKRSLDGMEPTFGIKHVVLTEFGDALRGYSRRGVAVVRNEEPWVQFHIIENRDGLCDASVVVLPTGLELPLLDRGGHPVGEGTLNETLHDFTHLLRKGRYEPELKVLEKLAAELSQRLARNPDAPRTLTKRNFGHEVVLAAKDGLLWAKELSQTASGSPCKVSQRDLEARDLPDGRVLWVSHRQRRLSSEVTLIGESLEGARYELSFHYPPQTHQRVARIFDKVLSGTQWPQFNDMTELLHAVPRSAFAIIVLTSMESYPSAANSVMRQIHKVAPELTIERGLPQDTWYRMDPYLADFVAELVMGRSPFFTVIDNGNPAESWCVQAFLDRDLKGSVYAINALGGSIVVRDSHPPGSPQSRRAQLVKFFKTLADDSSRITSNPNYTTGFAETRRNLPERQWNDALAYDNCARAASICWEALVKEGCFAPQRSASDMRWHSQKVSDGVWSVSIVAPGGRHGWLPYLINFHVTSDGITQVSYSGGRRGILGGLWGKRISVEGGGTLLDDQVEHIVRTLIRNSRGSLGVSVASAVKNISSEIRCTFLSSLRSVDPDRADFDLVKRLWSYLRNSW